MLMPILAVLTGLLLLVWSADRFVEGASSTAGHFSVPPLLVGMVIVGFGTSAPEMVVSTLAASQGNPGLALGNAWGSNIANIALILGVTALVAPIMVQSMILRKELPILTAVTLLAGFLVWDGGLSRADAWVLLGVFAVLVGSSQMRGWGAVQIAQSLGVSDLIIGLTVVAVGTSLPELASCVAAARKGEHDIALGKVLGSNLFNSLAVVGIAGAIAPMQIDAEVLTRDYPMMLGLTVVLFLMGWGFRKRQGRINRLEALALLAAYAGYTGFLITTMVPAA
jgi:cation:H+ antiporter